MGVLLNAKGITKRFGGMTAVNAVDLEIEEGSIVGLIGPNGAGKTTFFNSITGFYKADEGKVTFDGIDITKLTTYENCKNGMARTFQIVQPFGQLTSLENVMVGAFNHCKKYAEAEKLAKEMIAFVGLEDKTCSIVADLNIGDQVKF